MLRLLRISFRREQPDEAIKPCHLPVLINPPNSDVVHRGPAMHFRFSMSLGHDQRRTFEQQLPLGFVEFIDRHRTSVARGRGGAHYPQAPGAVEGDYLMALLVLDPVMPITQEHKRLLHQPAQEIADFDQLALTGSLLANL